MIKFSEYLNIQESVATSRRVGITHLQEMRPEVFLDWIKSVKQEMGVLKNIKAVMKIDGLGARFGKDASGRVFFEGSRTGPIFDSGAFSAYARSSSDNVEVIARAEHYDNMLDIFKKSEFMKAVPNNAKVVTEIFYNPMAQENELGITFVSVQYDKKKLGSLMSILPYTVLDSATGRTHENADSILKDLYKLSTDKIKIINPNLKFNTIDVSLFVKQADAIPDDAKTLIQSRKHADRPAKQNLLNMIQKIKDDLADYLLSHEGIEGKFKLGPEIEGVVLHLPGKEGTAPYKITTGKFKQAIAAKKR